MKNKQSRRAVVLVSGGLDSAVTLYAAIERGYACTCLIFDYGQRHRKEIASAKRIARKAGARFFVVKVDLPWKGSALLDQKISVPSAGYARQTIPVTYVPGRNIIFLSFAVSCAEAINAEAVFIGAHSQDYSGYPDCRPEFFDAFRKAVSRGTKAGVERHPIQIEAPLLHKGKAEIIRLGVRLKVPFGLTWSCYKGGARPCGVCDSCRFRTRGFREAGIRDKIASLRARRAKQS
jgi:7-cyano-7-deazaguanine synthase